MMRCQPLAAQAQAVSPITTTSPTLRLRWPARRYLSVQMAVGSSMLSCSKTVSSAAFDVIGVGLAGHVEGEGGGGVQLGGGLVAEFEGLQ